MFAIVPLRGEAGAELEANLDYLLIAVPTSSPRKALGSR